MSTPMWVVEHEDGTRRAWLGEMFESNAEFIRQKLEREWTPGLVTKRPFPSERYPAVAHAAHTREARRLGRPDPKPPEG